MNSLQDRPGHWVTLDFSKAPRTRWRHVSTVSNRGIVEGLLERNGHNDSDPIPVLRITEFRTPSGQTRWGLSYPRARSTAYSASSRILEPRVIFEHHLPCPRSGWWCDGGSLSE
jgi:hypothetical protein